VAQGADRQHLETDGDDLLADAVAGDSGDAMRAQPLIAPM
jgi:hypothetical protein